MAKALAAEQVTTWHTKNKVILITLGVLVAVIAAVLSGCGGDKSAASGSASVSAMAQTKEEASQQASKDSDLPEEYLGPGHCAAVRRHGTHVEEGSLRSAHQRFG